MFEIFFLMWMYDYDPAEVSVFKLRQLFGEQTLPNFNPSLTIRSNGLRTYDHNGAYVNSSRTSSGGDTHPYTSTASLVPKAAPCAVRQSPRSLSTNASAALSDLFESVNHFPIFPDL